MSPFARYLRAGLRSLGVYLFDDFVVFGSAVMKLHGLKDEIGDVDLLVCQSLYAELRTNATKWTEMRPRAGDPPLLEARYKDHTFNAFFAWTERNHWIDVPEAFRQREEVWGIQCVPLATVADWKRAALAIICEDLGIEDPTGTPWEKHVHDLAVLEAAGVAA